MTLDAVPGVCSDIATGDELPQGVLAAYAWDPFDRLEAHRSFVQDPAGVADPEQDSQATYTYDPLDRITAQSEWHDGNDTSEKDTAFSYLSLTSAVVTEHQTGADESPITTKTYRHDAFNRLVGMSNTGDDPDRGGEAGTFSYVNDVHGSVSLLLDDTGQAHATYGYTAYGAQSEDLSAGDVEQHDPLNPYRYTGKRLDTGTGTVDMGARRFGPDTGRFLSRDRYLGALADLGLSFDPLTGNRYALAAGNPISFIETDGHVVTANGGGGAVTTTADSTGYGVGDFVGDVGGFFRGFGEGLWESATGVVETGRVITGCHSGDAQRCFELGMVATTIADDPSVLVDGVVDPIVEDWQAGNQGEAIGRGTAFITEIVAGGKGVGAIAGTAGRTTTAAASAGARTTTTTSAGAATAAKSATTFRGDFRPPADIFKEGFQPVGKDLDLLRHANGTSIGGSGYVATSKLESVAEGFGPNVYTVRGSGGVDVNATLGTRSPYPHELEIAYPGGVPSSCIVGCTLPGGTWVPNPGFVP